MFPDMFSMKVLCVVLTCYDGASSQSQYQKLTLIGSIQLALTGFHGRHNQDSSKLVLARDFSRHLHSTAQITCGVLPSYSTTSQNPRTNGSDIGLWGPLLNMLRIDLYHVVIPSYYICTSHVTSIL